MTASSPTTLVRPATLAPSWHYSAVLAPPDDSVVLGYRTRSAAGGFGFGAASDAGGAVEEIRMPTEGHAMVIAPTGTGKGVSSIIPALLDHRGPVIVVDPKAEAYAVTARRRREMGQRVILLDPFGCVDGAEADRLNPLDLVDRNDPHAPDDCAALAAMLCPITFTREPYWDMRASQLLSGLTYATAVTEGALPGARSLSAVKHALSLPPKDLRDLLGKVDLAAHPDLEGACGILDMPAEVTQSCIISTAQNRLDWIRGSVRHAIDSSTFDIDWVTDGRPLSIYIVIPPTRLTSHQALLRCWIGALMQAVMRRRRIPTLNTLFVLDEAAQLGPLEELRQAVTLLRGYGLQVLSAWQDVAQIQRLYPEDWRTLCGSNAVISAFGFRSAASANAVAEIVGYGDWVGGHAGRALLGLDTRDTLLMQAGQVPEIVRRVDYLGDLRYAGRFDQNPYHAKRRIETAGGAVAERRDALRAAALGR